jgi:hypothetical protein
MTNVLFVPWRRATQLDKALFVGRAGRSPDLVGFAGEEYRSKNDQWKTLAQDDKMKTKKQFYEVWYSGSQSVILFSMTDGQIYIRGHGQPGENHISSGDDTHDTACITANDVAHRLIDSGLQTSFAGKIKCYNCHSAEAGWKGAPFAQVFADAMAAAGYTNCTYWGYLGSLTSFYETWHNDPQLHKYAGHKEDFGDGAWVMDDARASQRRLQITPRLAGAT